MKLNVCVDIDGTITEPYYWLEMANKYFKTDVEPHQIAAYDIHEVLGIPKEDYNEFYEMFGHTMHSNALIREQSREVLEVLNYKHNVYYVTARNIEMETVTRNWILKNRLPEAQLYLLGSHHKVEKAKELSCDIFVEDRYENAMELALSGFEVILIDCGYNRKSLMPGITRVFNWREINNAIVGHTLRANKQTFKIA